jgi:Kdo2-lipid IVA lauroyltransferase/acyltransferase
MFDLLATFAARALIAYLRRNHGFDGAALGDLAWHVLPGRRRIALENVRACLPDLDAERIARASFRSFGRVLAEAFRLPDNAPRTIWTGPDALSAIARDQRPAVVVSAHVGNWEVAGYAIVTRNPGRTHLIVAPPRERRLAALMAAHRRRIGVVPHPREGPVRPILRALREGAVVATAADQWPGDRASTVCPFLGRPPPFTLGPYRLAMAAHVPVVGIAAMRTDDGYRIETEPLWNCAEPVAAEDIARRYTMFVERLVRAHPDQYLWMHRRWKGGSDRR